MDPHVLSSARARRGASEGRAQALSAGAPAASYVVTPDWPKNWLAPMWLPTRFIDRAICARFGLLRRAGDWSLDTHSRLVHGMGRKA